MDTTPLDTALAAMQTSAANLDTDVAAQTNTGTALTAAQTADKAAQARIATDKADLQSKADALVAAIVGMGLQVNIPPTSTGVSS